MTDDKQTCFGCRYSVNYGAPDIDKQICMEDCRRGSAFKPFPTGDPDAERLVDKGKEIDRMVGFVSGIGFCMGESDPEACSDCFSEKDCQAMLRKEQDDLSLNPVSQGSTTTKLWSREDDWDAECAAKLDAEGTKDDGTMRTFASGATRDTGEGKLDYAGFLSPQALKQFAKYMNMNRLQSDGQLRDSDNWKAGFPMGSYVSSGFRHFTEWWETYLCENWNGDREQTIKMIAALCGLWFNVQGKLHELLKIVEMVDFDGTEPTKEMKERRDALSDMRKEDVS